MAIEGKGRFINRRTPAAKNKIYNRYFIYVPTNVADDSSFPFKEQDEVIIKIDISARRLIIESAKKENK